MGDFNDVEDGDVLQFLQGKLRLGGITGNFKEALSSYQLQQPNKIKIDSTADFWTYTTLEKAPKKRIDFILYRFHFI